MTKSVLKSGAIVLVLSTMSAFASTHYVSQTVKPTAKLVYSGVKFTSHAATFPVRHPVKTSKGFGKGVAVVAKTVF